MIAVISTGFVFEGLVKYHSNKIESENSLIISSNLYANNLEEYQHRIENIADSYHGKNTKPVKHFILSLPPDEKLNEQKFAAASKEYLEKMGYDQNPYVTILHTDEKHQHVHIITTNIRFDGGKTSDKFERVKSQRALREIEQKYDLKIGVGEEKQEKKKLDEINLEKYQFSNAFKIAIKKGLFTEKDIKNLYYRKQPTDKELLKFLGFKYKIYQNRAINLGLVNWTKKQLFSNELKEIYKNSNSKKEYIQKLKDKNIYYREINNQIKYGFDGVYYNQNKLSQRYGLENINKLDNKLYSIKEYLKTQINISISNSTNIQQFINNLEVNKIESKIHSNARGIYGISFIYNGNEYKASDIDRNLSYIKIEKELNKNDKEIIIKNEKDEKLENENISSNYIPGLNELINNLDDKENEEIKKKKKRMGKNL